MSSAQLQLRSDFPQRHAPVSAVALVKTLYALALAFETVEGENLEKLKLNDYNVTNLSPSRFLHCGACITLTYMLECFVPFTKINLNQQRILAARWSKYN